MEPAVRVEDEDGALQGDHDGESGGQYRLYDSR